MANAQILGDEDVPIERRILGDFGYFGHYLHVHSGGRSGKMHILIKLLKADGSLTQRELLESSCISSAALSEVLAKLEAEELIVRTRSDSDRRQLKIELTPAGAEKAAELRAAKRAFESSALSCLTPDEIVQLEGLLSKVAAHWRALDGAEVSA